MVELYLDPLRDLIIEQLRGISIGALLMMICILALVVLVPGYIIHIKREIPYSKVIYLFIYLMYLGIILFITVLRRYESGHVSGINTRINWGFTTKGIYSTRQMIYSLLNVALFVPWGVLNYLGQMPERCAKALLMTTLIGFITSFAIEVYQGITGTGIFEVTDITTNVVGCFLGALITMLFYEAIKRIRKNG